MDQKEEEHFGSRLQKKCYFWLINREFRSRISSLIQIVQLQGALRQLQLLAWCCWRKLNLSRKVECLRVPCVFRGCKLTGSCIR